LLRIHLQGASSASETNVTATALSNVGVLKARPHSVAIGVTGKCNLRCSYCHKSDAVFEARPAANADLSDEVIGVKHVTLSAGGETTMFAGWHERIACFLDDPEIEAHIVSNFARLFNDDDLDALAKFKAIQVSFDSADLQVVRKLRSKADLRTIAFNIVRLRQRGEELGRKPLLVVNCTLWRENIGEIAKLAGFCRELGVDQLLLTEGFVSTEHNYTVPETLDALTDDEVILLAQQIVAAEALTADGLISLQLQGHLRLRLEPVLQDVRDGRQPQNAASSFSRRVGLSACYQPWQSPLVMPDGKVLPCCVAPDTAAIGDLTHTTSMTDILESDAALAIRASILDGKPLLPCNGCSFATDLSRDEFVQEIREWYGEAVTRQSDVKTVTWANLFGVPENEATLENANLITEPGVSSLNEDNSYGMHRVLVDTETSSEMEFRVRANGRRRIRLDLADERGRVMVGRAHLAVTRVPSAETAMGELRYRLTPSSDGWLTVMVQSSKSFSHFNITLMRDDNAVVYRGDGKSAVDISDLRIA
jgi:MoaA/NifB/PqqE/SkfB family radical SAM enzyme